MNKFKALLLGSVVSALFSLNVSADHLSEAVANSERPKADVTRDPLRKPDEVLRFFGVAPGMQVLDLFSGAGYYTEILSYAVGEEGAVTAHNNQAFLSIIRNSDERYDGNRLANVTRLNAEPPTIPLSANKYDFALMALAYHDFYIRTQDWPEFDVPQLLKIVFDSVKSGGVVGIVDHAAAEGTGSEDSKRLHRIDPGFVIGQMVAAGFVLEADSDLLANPEDPHDIPMWDPSIRSNTDRFILRFRKP